MIVSHGDAEAQRDRLLWVASLAHTNLTTLLALRVYHEGHEEHEGIRQHISPVAGTGLQHLSVSLWLCEKNCLRVNGAHRRVRRAASHRQCPACDGFLLLVLTETRSHREGRSAVGASLAHTNLTTLMALRVYHEEHEEHEGIREHSVPVAGTGLQHLAATPWLCVSVSKPV